MDSNLYITITAALVTAGIIQTVVDELQIFFMRARTRRKLEELLDESDED